MIEFRYGDRVRPVHYAAGLGTVVNETHPRIGPIMGSYRDCLPLPVLVRWDEPGETYWEKAEDLELVK
jgi:hypothetical protein